MLEIFISLQDHMDISYQLPRLKLSVLCLAPNYFESLKENGMIPKKMYLGTHVKKDRWLSSHGETPTLLRKSITTLLYLKLSRRLAPAQ